MVIAIDVGNSAIKVARITDGVVGAVRRVATGSWPDVAAVLAAIEASAAPAIPPDSSVALVSVVPSWTATIADLATDRGWSLTIADADTIPIPARVRNPERVGADRLLGGWSARETYGAPVIVVDSGTATTIDVVDSTGSFAGGAILPGVELAIRSLTLDTALLPPVPARLPEHGIGRDTVAAIQSGTVLGHALAISGLVARMIDELGGSARPAVVMTGGAAATLGDVDGVDHIDPDLLLRGLGRLAGRLAVTR